MSISFPKTEEEVIRFWREVDAFQTQLRLTEGNKKFTFYDGPPFATGLPHYGHLLTSTIKDIIPRYWSMKGYHVTRRFGWDTHGLPIEYEIDKKHGISARDAVAQMGVAAYNAECKAIVMRYAAEWRQIIERLGRWIDFDNDYKSMDVTFMESCWWVFKQLFDKDQVYRAYQIMPYSTALGTPLSQMEAKQNEKTTQDPAILVAFPVVGQTGSLVIYTTTPWTLPSNILIAVHRDFEYLEILDEKSGKQYFMMESGLAALYGKELKKAKYKVLRKLQGKDLIGWKYEPLFPYFAESYKECFEVIGADYVEAGEGTGIVHQAPAFGQEDYDAAVASGFIGEKRLPPCPVDEKGQFTAEVPDYVGQHVKTADKAILKDLRSTGRLLVESQTSHVDKFCWRSDTQLIRRAVSSWFIRVTNSIPEMLENLEKTTWVPSFVKEKRFAKRFANWIANAHDWNVSRNRYWGTPIPLWVSEDFEEVVCVGSIAELKELSGYTGELNDLHRDKVDHIEIPSKKGKGMLKRVDEVFDCWFESGSMPYASTHYPFENADNFQGSLFPADFIAEGLDQTRGWFYTLTVLGNKLFGVSPFRNCITNGLVLASTGVKMSKSLKNYPDPSNVINEYGSDALRLYLINSPVVRAEPLRFKESGVKEVVSKVLLPLWNSYRFFCEQALLYKKNNGEDFAADPTFTEGKGLENVMDRWILADCQSMLQFIDQEMAAYRLYTVVPRLLSVLDNLTNWYIRFNRKRLKGVAGLGLDDTKAALNTLLQVLLTLVRALAPFTPFITEHIYSLLKPFLGEVLKDFTDSRSVHFLPFPTVQEALFDTEIERKVSSMQKVINLGRTARERRTLSLKTPLRSIVVVSDEQHLKDVESLQSYVMGELNVQEVVLSNDEAKYGIILEAKVDWPTLGKKLKKDVQIVRKALPKLSQEQLRQYLTDKTINIDGIQLEENDLEIVRVLANKDGAKAAGELPQLEPAFSNDVIILLDTDVSAQDLVYEGLAREVINRVQRMRKKAGLVPTDEVHMQYGVVANPESTDVDAVLESKEELFVNALRGKLEPLEGASGESVILEEEQAIGELRLMLRLARI
ncbi:Isoleucine--tRNA ligase like protein [Verticillium longisporum]|uniref:Isoleucine--tRNA ligase, cytoplasmic n=1 Tax=Verticillium longisporum TaxID=100787 RepID=A0A8I2ZVJ1_VERLO|nr:Isoleucine--tRNA ligase like protein [Verticillium longisporum]